MDYEKEIVKVCSNLGLDTIGFTECRKFHELTEIFNDRKKQGIENEFEEKIIENRINPNIYMSEGKTIISIAFPYIYDLDYKDGITFSKYTLGNDYHIVIKEYLDKICTFINGLGGKAQSFVDNNYLPERYIAYLCGLGFIGRNNMLITKKYGSYVFLGEIITDLKIVSSSNCDLSYNNLTEDRKYKCNRCECCLNACPTSSIKKDEMCNPNYCLSYITQKKNIEDEWFEKLNGRLFGCDSCQKVCSYNKNVSVSNLIEFKPYDFMQNINTSELINMANSDFKEKYKLTASAWRGKNIIIRNALINYMIESRNKNIIKNINSPYIKDYYNRLLDKLLL